MKGEHDMGTLLIIIGVCFIIAGFLEKKSEKEKKEQRLFNENCYNLFEEHHWLDFGDGKSGKKKHKH